MKVSFTWSANSVAPGFPSCLPTQGSSATVEDQDGNNPSGTATLPAHGSLYLTVQDTSIPSYTAACDTQTVTFQVTAQAVTPAPTLTSPANGSTVTNQPTFSGTA